MGGKQERGRGKETEGRIGSWKSRQIVASSVCAGWIAGFRVESNEDGTPVEWKAARRRRRT